MGGLPVETSPETHSSSHWTWPPNCSALSTSSSILKLVVSHVIDYKEREMVAKHQKFYVAGLRVRRHLGRYQGQRWVQKHHLSVLKSHCNMPVSLCCPNEQRELLPRKRPCYLSSNLFYSQTLNSVH